MSSDVKITRPLNSLSHEESKRVLESLGCDPITENSNFVQVKINGWDLVVIKSLEDLDDCGIQSRSRVRLKSIIARLEGFGTSGVPISLLGDASESPVNTTSSADQPKSSAMELSQPVLIPVSSVPNDHVRRLEVTNSGQPQPVVIKESGGSSKEMRIMTPPTTAMPHSEGVSFKALLRSIHSKVDALQTSNNSDVPLKFRCYYLDNEIFQQLYTFRPGEGTLLRQMTIRELYGRRTVVQPILQGQYHDQDGLLKPPDEFYRQLYGRVTSKFPNKIITNRGNYLRPGYNTVEDSSPFYLHSPYRHLYNVNLHPKCSLVMIPNNAHPAPGGHALRFTLMTRNGNHVVGDTGSGTVIATTRTEPRIRIIFKNVTGSVSDLTGPSQGPKKHNPNGTIPESGANASNGKQDPTMSIQKYGTVQPLIPLQPRTVPLTEMEDESDLLDEGVYSAASRIYFLWNLQSMSLMAVREGLLVLVSDKEEKTGYTAKRFHLAVLYFNDKMALGAVVRLIDETWRRCKERLELCQWKPFAQMARDVQPTMPITFSLPPIGSDRKKNLSAGSTNENVQQSVPSGPHADGSTGNMNVGQNSSWPNFIDATGLLSTIEPLNNFAVYPNDGERADHGQRDDGDGDTDGGIPADWYENDQIWLPSHVAQVVEDVVNSDDNYDDYEDDRGEKLVEDKSEGVDN